MDKLLNVGNWFINRYLLPVGEEYCLIDTGYKWSYDEFCKKCAKNNLDVKKIKYIVVTHMHADHAGFVKEFLAKNSDVTLIYDFDDERRLHAGKNNLNTYISGFLQLVSSKISVAFVDKTQCFPAVVYEKSVDAKTQPLLDYGIEFVSLKGHTECDLCIKYNNKLLCGDLFMSGITAISHAPMWIYNKYDMLESWRKVVNMAEIVYIYPSHGKPFMKKDISSCIEAWRTKGVFRLYAKK